MDADRKLELLGERLRGLGGALVAYSGGVDSAFLLKVATDALGERALGAIADSPSLPREELAAAREVAAAMGARLVVVPTGETDRPEYRANGPDRCYHCKATLFRALADLARAEGLAAILYGAIPEDAADVRPGQRAAREAAVLAPLVEVGLTKPEIRALSARMGLATWDKPAFACLASRVPHGTPVTPDLLRRIEAGESVLRRLGFRQFRLRHHGDVARIELEADEIARAASDGVREELGGALRALGWRFVSLDLAGYRAGSLAVVESRDR